MDISQISSQIKEEYQNAMKDQSYPEMKAVAQKLMNYMLIESVSETYVKYTKFVKYRDETYEIQIEPDQGSLSWVILNAYDTHNVIAKGSEDSSDPEEVFDDLISKFAQLV